MQLIWLHKSLKNTLNNCSPLHRYKSEKQLQPLPCPLQPCTAWFWPSPQETCFPCSLASLDKTSEKSSHSVHNTEAVFCLHMSQAAAVPSQAQKDFQPSRLCSDESISQASWKQARSGKKLGIWQPCRRTCFTGNSISCLMQQHYRFVQSYQRGMGASQSIQTHARRPFRRKLDFSKITDLLIHIMKCNHLLRIDILSISK